MHKPPSVFGGDVLGEYDHKGVFVRRIILHKRMHIFQPFQVPALYGILTNRIFSLFKTAGRNHRLNTIRCHHRDKLIPILFVN